MKMMDYSVFESNYNFVQAYLRGSHLTAFSGFSVYARKSGLYIKFVSRNRRNSKVEKTVGLNIDWKIFGIASKPWLKAQLDRSIHQVSEIRSNKYAKAA